MDNNLQTDFYILEEKIKKLLVDGDDSIHISYAALLVVSNYVEEEFANMIIASLEDKNIFNDEEKMCIEKTNNLINMLEKHNRIGKEIIRVLKYE